MAHIRLNISGLKNRDGQDRIERALRDLPGVWAAVVCLDQSYADVEYMDDYGPSTDDLVTAIADAGFTARIGG